MAQPKKLSRRQRAALHCEEAREQLRCISASLRVQGIDLRASLAAVDGVLERLRACAPEDAPTTAAAMHTRAAAHALRSRIRLMMTGAKLS